MIQLVVNEIEAETNAMRPFNPIEVGHVGVDAVIPFHRAPVVGVAERAIAADIEDREAALPDIRAVGPRNL